MCKTLKKAKMRFKYRIFNQIQQKKAKLQHRSALM